MGLADNCVIKLQSEVSIGLMDHAYKTTNELNLGESGIVGMRLIGENEILELHEEDCELEANTLKLGQQT